MCPSSVLFLGLLAVAQVASCVPAKNSASHSISENNLITFTLNSSVRINGTDFVELNCTSQNSLVRKACANITQVTCQAERFGRVSSCLVSNEDSIFFNSSIANETLVCNQANQTKGNCYLVFFPDQLGSSRKVGHSENGPSQNNPLIISSWEDYGQRRREIEDDAQRIQTIVLISMIVFLSVVFGIPILFCCLVIVNNVCLGGRFNFPLDHLIRDTCFTLQRRDEFPDGVTVSVSYN